MGKTFWLVTVVGYNYHYNPPHKTVSVAIELSDGKTPIDWYASRPRVRCHFEFIPHALLNFWEITATKFKKLNKKGV